MLVLLLPVPVPTSTKAVIAGDFRVAISWHPRRQYRDIVAAIKVPRRRDIVSFSHTDTVISIGHIAHILDNSQLAVVFVVLTGRRNVTILSPCVFNSHSVFY